MKLEDAAKILKGDVDRFETHYRDGMNNTDHYPDDLSEEEWYEQFFSFLSLEESN